MNKKEQQMNKNNAGRIQNVCCDSKPTSKLKIFIPVIFSFLVLVIGMTLDYIDAQFFQGFIRISWYLIAYYPVGFLVLKSAWNGIKKGDFFTEFLLMSIATLGAFAIGEYPEGVAVMLFYSVGELFQEAAVKKARGNIQALLDIQPKEANVYRAGKYIRVNPETVSIGEIIQIRKGEKIPLDGKLISSKAVVNTAAITGESKPNSLLKDENVFAGSINLENVIEVEVTKAYHNSSVARIMELVQNAAARKSKTELFIRKFAKVYTPAVVFLAVALTLVPYFFVNEYIFGEWLYRALIFLVVSCPCALVISIPLGYFGGLGAASKNGILFKGASFLDDITKINTVVFDKTGTLTKGVFKIKEIETFNWDENEMMTYLIAMETNSTHPIAKAILCYKITGNSEIATEISEIAGQGLTGKINGKTVLVGNVALMKSNKIEIPDGIELIEETTVLVVINGIVVGYVVIADELKEDALLAIQKIRNSGISRIGLLSGDKDSITQKLGTELGISQSMGGLLPEDKLLEIEKLKQQPGTKIAFVGDGINDAPVLAASDVGIAMGSLGSDVAIETADVILQSDHPSKVGTAIEIGKATRRVVWQNIGLAFGVKLIVLFLGAIGLATMWGAVFADVGVALLAILNAVRLQKMKWN